MNIDDFYSLGYIKKPVKHQGEIIVFLDVDDPETYHNLNGFFIEMPTGLVPFFIEKINLRSNGDAVVKLEGIDSEDEALELKGRSLWIPLDALPKLSGNQFYFHEVIGWKVIDKSAGEIGVVKDILDNMTQPLFQIIHSSGVEILIPVHDDILERIDRSDNSIFIAAPDGLLDLFLPK
ncbi:MAG: ribosome maturation factor RimM [Bacteroidales bacterium]|jgi:16S rRNA processing protein RimM|nr:ribosome maturation factor RimM [Bacteroidales bacterium]